MPEGDKGQKRQIPEGLYIQFRQPSGAYGCTREGVRGNKNRKLKRWEIQLYQKNL